MDKSFFTKERKGNILFHSVLVLLFALAACIYNAPILEGKVIAAGDRVSGVSAIQESVNFREEGGNTFWTNGMFSGMPNYQIGGGEYLIQKVFKPVFRLLYWGHRNNIFLLIYFLIASFVLLRTFKIDKWISVAGAFAISFSSYFFIIQAAAHNGKATSITYMMLVIAGTMMLYRKQYGWGVAMIMFFTMIGFHIHPQMSYYLCMLIGIIVCTELYIHIKEKKMKQWYISSALFIAAFAVGMGTQMANTISNSEYVQETMRGGHSELSNADDSATSSEKGLSLNYATQWSYGIKESFTFMIPNFMGGGAGYNVDADSKLYDEMVKNRVPNNSAKQFCAQAPTYWGTQPFTHGPVYMGAIVCFLFILGLLIVKSPYKWALLIATAFSVLLSWGHNFMWFTEIFYNYFPLYNKFRAVSSILIVAEITMPVLGFLALKSIINKEIETKKIQQSIQISLGITGGLCLIFALFGGSLYTFTSPNDAQFVSQIPAWLYDAIKLERADMLQTSAWRSLIFIALGAALTWVLTLEKISVKFAGLALTALILGDMWTVNKEYYNESSFITKRHSERIFAMQPHEKAILADKDPHFRVFNLTVNSFNDARTSYYLKSVGGYHAAKLRRYQDLIDEHLSKMHYGVFNMLNTKYYITQNQEGQVVPVLNPDAMGNVWFVNAIKTVDTPQAESDALNTIDLKNEAVADKKFEKFAISSAIDSAANIHLTSYTPNKITYTSNAAIEKTAVFSEIYYPYGWNAYIDNEPVEHFRVNYVLRALNIPAGEHEIRFEFKPESVQKGNILSLVCIIIMLGTMLGFLAHGIYKRKIQTA